MIPDWLKTIYKDNGLYGALATVVVLLAAIIIFMYLDLDASWLLSLWK